MSLKFERNAGLRGNRRALATWLLMGVTCAFFAFALPSGASGALPSPALFQLDGNATTQPTDGTGDDWDRIYCAQPGVRCDPSPGAPSALSSAFVGDHSYFAGGAQDGDDTPHGCGGDSNSKAELDDAFGAVYLDASDNHTIVYFGGDRAPSHGDVGLGFWLNGSGTSASPGLSTTACWDGEFEFWGHHHDGDLFVALSFASDGSVSNSAIYEWGSGRLTRIASETTCTTPSSATAIACAIANSGTISTPWPRGGTAPGSAPARDFFEGGIDLTALYQTLPTPQPVPCFDSFYLESRASHSFDSALKDFAFGHLNTCNPQIQVTNTADASAVDAGSPIGFTVNVSNPGSAVTNGVTVNDSLPAGVTWSVDTQSNAGLCSVSGLPGSQVLACGGSSATLAASASFSVHIAATTSSTACSTYAGTAHVTTSNAGNSQAAASITCNPASIHIVKTADATPVNAGDLVGFAVTVSNSGAGAAHGVTMSDPLPAGVTWTVDTQSNAGLCAISGAAGSQVLACGGSSTNVAAGGSFSVHVKATTSSSACSTYSSTASVTTSNDGSGTSSASIACNAASIHIADTADAATVNQGDPVGFTVTVSNGGAGIAHGVTANDPLPAGVTWTVDTQSNAGLCAISGAAGSQVLACGGSSTNVAAGGSFTVHVTATTAAGSCSTYANAAGATTTNDGTATSSASITCKTPPPPPGTAGISISNNPKVQSIASGATASFTIVVTNTGSLTLTNVTVSDPLSPNCTSGLGSMASGAIVTFGCSLANVTASFTNVATATGTGSNSQTVSSTDSAPVTVQALVPPRAPTPHPAIAITKDPKSQSIAHGGTARFTITVRNTGDVTLDEVAVTDPLSPDCSRSLGTLAAGQSKSYSCSKAGSTASFQNVATVSGKPPTTAVVTASDQATITVAPPPQHPQLGVVKSPKVQTLVTRLVTKKNADGSSTTTVTYGTAHFTIRVTNRGDVTLHGVAVSDPASPGCNKTIGTLGPKASKTYSCARLAVVSNFTNIATAHGISPKGVHVEASDHAKVKVKVK